MYKTNGCYTETLSNCMHPSRIKMYSHLIRIHTDHLYQYTKLLLLISCMLGPWATPSQNNGTGFCEESQH